MQAEPIQPRRRRDFLLAAPEGMHFEEAAGPLAWCVSDEIGVPLPPRVGAWLCVDADQFDMRDLPAALRDLAQALEASQNVGVCDD